MAAWKVLQETDLNGKVIVTCAFVCVHECEDLCRCRWEDHVKGISSTALRGNRGPLLSSSLMMFPTRLQLWSNSATALKKWHSLVSNTHLRWKTSWMQGLLYPVTPETLTLQNRIHLPLLLLLSNQLLSNPIRPTEAFHLESSGRVDYAHGRRGMAWIKVCTYCMCVHPKQRERQCWCVCVSMCLCMCALQPICTVAGCVALPVCVGLGVLHVCVYRFIHYSGHCETLPVRQIGLMKHFHSCGKAGNTPPFPTPFCSAQNHAEVAPFHILATLRMRCCSTPKRGNLKTRCNYNTEQINSIKSGSKH